MLNQRLRNLQAYCDYLEATSANKANSVRASLRRNRIDSVQNPLKALNSLREMLQDSINLEIKAVVDRYVEQFFSPAIVNIRQNGLTCGDDDLHQICRRILDEAKCCYESTAIASTEDHPFDGFQTPEPPVNVLINKNIPADMRKYYYRDNESDAESDISQVSNVSRRRKQPQKTKSANVSSSALLKVPNECHSRSITPMFSPTPVDIAKLNPQRVNVETKFILGAKVNKAFGSKQRGRISTRHPNLFRYLCDNDDKLWLCEQGLSSRCSGKSLIMILEDVNELAVSPEYRLPEQQTTQLTVNSFAVTPQLLCKIRDAMLTSFNQQKRRSGADSFGSPSPLLGD